MLEATRINVKLVIHNIQAYHKKIEIYWGISKSKWQHNEFKSIFGMSSSLMFSIWTPNQSWKRC